MNPALILTLTFLCTALLVGGVTLVLHDMFFRYRSELSERLNELNGSTKHSADATLFDLKQLAVLSASRENAWSHLRNLVKHARLGIGLNALLIVSAGAGVLLAGGAYWLTRQWWLSPIGFVIGAAAPFVYAQSRYNGNIRQ